MASINSVSKPTVNSGKPVPSYDSLVNAESSAMQFLNVEENETVFQRLLIVHGQVPGIQGARDKVIVSNPRLPTLEFPAADGYFKASVRLEEGENTLSFEYTQASKCVSQGTLRIQMTAHHNKSPLQLAIMVAKDSAESFDTLFGPGNNNLDMAVRKLRCTAYMWQAFFAEHMYRHGFGRRTFALEEAMMKDTLSKDEAERMIAKVHIIRSRFTVAELRNKEIAQQWKFIAGEEEIKERHRPLDLLEMIKTEVRECEDIGDNPVACMMMDAHWDAELQIVVGQGAYGSSDPQPKVATLGSHRAYSWPATFDEIPSAFMDITPTDPQKVANNSKVCAETWQVAAVSIGTFVNMVMGALSVRRSPTGITQWYRHLNRAFMACEPNRPGPIKQHDEDTAHFHRTDAVRLRHHPCLRLPSDLPLAEKQAQRSAGTITKVDGGFLLRNESGITLVQVWLKGECKAFIEYTVENFERRKNGEVSANEDEKAAEFPLQVMISNERLLEMAGERAG
ncbi:hypothetical protein GGF43_005013, partial [Coemansia sp. RSA 2618]